MWIGEEQLTTNILKMEILETIAEYGALASAILFAIIVFVTRRMPTSKSIDLFKKVYTWINNILDLIAPDRADDGKVFKSEIVKK